MIKHSKYKNPALLYELLIRQITADALSSTQSKAADILKSYFLKGELAKEYKLYETIINSNTASEQKATMVLTTVLEANKTLNKTSLKKKKYNIIKEIKQHYDVEKFFQYRVPNYRILASIYTLFESANNNVTFKDPQQVVANKTTILEYITKKPISQQNTIVDEYSKLDKDLQILTYRKLIERFNDKYSTLSKEQRDVLKEYITVDSSTNEFKDTINNKLLEVKKQLKKLNSSVSDSVVKIKVNEIISSINSVDKVKDETVADLLQYYELVKEIKAL